LSDEDIQDLLMLVDLQSKHMTHSARESRGAGYEAENAVHCGEITLVKQEALDLDIDIFDPADYADGKRLDKYTGAYNLTPMGASGGLWFYLDEKAVCGSPDDAYRYTTIPSGTYVIMTVSEPFAFSAMRAWDVLCLWIRKKGLIIAPVDIGGVQTPMLVAFSQREGKQRMEVAVPVLVTE